MDLHRSTFPIRHQISIIDAELLNFRVRDGIGWTSSPKAQVMAEVRQVLHTVRGRVETNLLILACLNNNQIFEQALDLLVSVS